MLGETRILLFELVLALVMSESTMLRNDYPILEGIFNSTIQILLVWTLDSIHSSILVCKAFTFFRLYLSRATESSICNAFIRTRALENMADFYIEARRSKKAMTTEEKANLEDLIDVFDTAGVASRCPSFIAELRLLTKWRFCKHLRE